MTAEWGHRFALLGNLGLIALWLAWVTVLAPYPPAARAPVLTLATLPMLLNLRGLIHQRRQSYVWLGLISLGYFIHGASAISSDTEHLPAAMEVALSLALFGGCLAWLRLQR